MGAGVADNVHETGVSLDGQSASPIVAAEAEQVEQLEEQPGHGPRSEVFVPFRISRLAVDNIPTMTRSLSSALIPLVLAAAFTAVKVAIHTTTARATGVSAPAAELWIDYVGTAVYSAFAGVAALNCLITVLVGRRRAPAAMQLAGGSRRDLITMVAGETVIVTVTALLLAAGVAVATLAPILHTSIGRWLPSVPVTGIAWGILLVGSVVAMGMVVPTAVLTRTSPREVVEEEAP